jgi:hypothetical protein
MNGSIWSRRSVVIALAACLCALPLAFPARAQDGQEEPADSSTADTQPTPLFSDGFEATADLSLWTIKGDLEVQQREVISGGFAARGTSTGNGPRFATKKLDEESNDLYYRVRLNLMSQGGTPVNLLRLRTARGDTIVSLYVDPAGRLGYLNDVTGDHVVSPVIVDRGTWHELQLHARIGPDYGLTEVWLDEKLIAELTGNAGLGTTAIGRVELGDNAGGHVYDVAFDDVMVQSSFISPSEGPTDVPGTLNVQTLPPLPGVSFTIDGRTFVTDDHGFVHIEIDRWTQKLKERIEIPDTMLPDGSRASFARWFGWSNTLEDDVTAAFFVEFPIAYTFIDLQGNPIDPATVDSLTFKSSTGVSHTFKQGEHTDQHMLRGSRVVPTQAGPINKNLYYTLESVMVNGSDVVNRAQQRYHPATESAWTVQLRYFFVDFTARDAFFGFPIGSALKLVNPDGNVERVPFESGANLRLGPLPRGEYQVSAVGPGFSPPAPLMLTRDQFVEMKIITYVDMAFAGIVLAAIGFGLLFAGRPQLLLTPVRLIRHPSQLVQLVRALEWRALRRTPQ